jgi:adenylylsulfate kinase-like enzyme
VADVLGYRSAMASEDLRAVLITGVFGSGKSSVAMEMADVLESRDEAYAMLDLDFLDWFSRPGDDDHDVHRMLLANMAAVLGNYRAADVSRFILARSFREAWEIEDVRTTVGTPMLVVRLTAPLEEIERRLEADVTRARRDDLEEAAVWLAEGTGEGLEDVTIASDRPVREVATEILSVLGWL